MPDIPSAAHIARYEEDPPRKARIHCFVDHGMDRAYIHANQQNHITMLRWVVTFLVIALIAGLLGFTGLAAGAAAIAKVVFYIFLVLLVLSLLFGSRIWKNTP